MTAESVLSRIKNTKGLVYIAVGLAAALILLLFPASEQAETDTLPQTSEYKKALEAELSQLIGSIDGVKGCAVSVTLESGYEYTYAADKYLSQKFSSDGKAEQTEAKTEIFASSDGKALPVKEKMPRVSGVAVVCKSADASARLKIISLLTALFGIGSDRISVQT